MTQLRILVINPNTTPYFTQACERAAKNYANLGTEIIPVNPEKGPATIESYYDEFLAVPGVLEEVKKGINRGCDGIIIACFGDPGLYAAREVAEVPVVGIAEAAMLMACMLGAKFSVLTILHRFRIPIEEVLKKYGLEDRCASVRTTGLSVSEMENREKAVQALIREGRRAVEQDGAEVLILGCAGMSGLERTLEEALKVPVVDPVVAAVKMVEAIVGYGKKTSKLLTFMVPPKKEIKGYPEIMQS